MVPKSLNKRSFLALVLLAGVVSPQKLFAQSKYFELAELPTGVSGNVDVEAALAKSLQLFDESYLPGTAPADWRRLYESRIVQCIVDTDVFTLRWDGFETGWSKSTGQLKSFFLRPDAGGGATSSEQACVERAEAYLASRELRGLKLSSVQRHPKNLWFFVDYRADLPGRTHSFPASVRLTVSAVDRHIVGFGVSPTPELVGSDTPSVNSEQVVAKVAGQWFQTEGAWPDVTITIGPAEYDIPFGVELLSQSEVARDAKRLGKLMLRCSAIISDSTSWDPESRSYQRTSVGYVDASTGILMGIGTPAVLDFLNGSVRATDTPPSASSPTLVGTAWATVSHSDLSGKFTKVSKHAEGSDWKPIVLRSENRFVRVEWSPSAGVVKVGGSLYSPDPLLRKSLRDESSKVR